MSGIQYNSIANETTLEIDGAINAGSILLNDEVSPANPLDGQGILFKKTGDDGVFWLPDSTGVEVDLTGGGGGFIDPMTTRGDLIYKDAANATVRLPTGSADQVLTSDGTDTSWVSPDVTWTSPNVNDLYGDTITPSLTTGSSNTLLGVGTSNITTATNNIAIGASSGGQITTGSDCVTIGRLTTSDPTGYGQIAIGAGATTLAANQCSIGGSTLESIAPHPSGTCDLGRIDSKFQDLHLAGDSAIGGHSNVDGGMIINNLTGGVLPISGFQSIPSPSTGPWGNATAASANGLWLGILKIAPTLNAWDLHVYSRFAVSQQFTAHSVIDLVDTGGTHPYQVEMDEDGVNIIVRQALDGTPVYYQRSGGTYSLASGGTATNCDGIAIANDSSVSFIVDHATNQLRAVTLSGSTWTDASLTTDGGAIVNSRLLKSVACSSNGDYVIWRANLLEYKIGLKNGTWASSPTIQATITTLSTALMVSMNDAGDRVLIMNNAGDMKVYDRTGSTWALVHTESGGNPKMARLDPSGDTFYWVDNIDRRIWGVTNLGAKVDFSFPLWGGIPTHVFWAGQGGGGLNADEYQGFTVTATMVVLMDNLKSTIFVSASVPEMPSLMLTKGIGSTLPENGELVVTGGVGIMENLNVGGTINGVTPPAVEWTSPGSSDVFGDSAAAGYTTGENNVAIGVGALALTSGSSSINIGTSAGSANSTNDGQINIGVRAGQNSNTHDNINIGYQAGISQANNVESSVCLGSNAATFATTASRLIAIGRLSANGVTNQHDCVAIGSNSQCGAAGDNQICIGSSATTNQPNQCAIGNNDLTAIVPGLTATCDLGIPSRPFADLHLSGSSTINSVLQDAARSCIGEINYTAVPGAALVVIPLPTGTLGPPHQFAHPFDYAIGSATGIAGTSAHAINTTNSTDTITIIDTGLYRTYYNISAALTTGLAGTQLLYFLKINGTTYIPSYTLAKKMQGRYETSASESYISLTAGDVVELHTSTDFAASTDLVDQVMKIFQWSLAVEKIHLNI